MAVVYKCKMCGGDLEVRSNEKVAKCPYCGAMQTLPNTNDEVISNLYNRANNLRLKCEFDKAEAMYDKIIELDDRQSEAHWGIVLCKYGIEYIEDPKTFNRVPTCHRTLYDAVLTDVDYLTAIENADLSQKALYESEAKQIDNIQKNILSVVKDEKPFDVFICYKETDDNGKRTIDSTIANDIYYQLTQEGFKVFYAAVTLEDKLGEEYEPYIFAALNSAKVMLVLGTNPDYFTSVWVKNEWSRYLKLMKENRDRLLIPCYKDIDAYELPEEFAHLQAQDMGKIGFITDVIRGVRKVLGNETSTLGNSDSLDSVQNITPLLKRVFIFLEDCDWKSADEYCERILDQDPENAQAYLGKLLAETKVNKTENLSECHISFENSKNYLKIMRFADDDLKNEIAHYAETVNEYVKQETERKIREHIKDIDYEYNEAIKDFKTIMSIDKCVLINSYIVNECINLAKKFDSFRGYKDSANKAKQCLDKMEWLKNNTGTIVFSFRDEIYENNFSLIIDNEKHIVGSIMSKKEISYRIIIGKHSISLYSDHYTTIPKPIKIEVLKGQEKKLSIRNTFFKYKIDVIK